MPYFFLKEKHINKCFFKKKYGLIYLTNQALQINYLILSLKEL